MIWPFRPRCPLDVYEKVWVELRLARLAEEFGIDRLLTGNDVFDASTRIFDEHGATVADTMTLLSAICEQMRFDPDRFSLKSEEPGERETAVTQGAWEVDDDGRYVIRIKDADAGGVELQVAILARVVGCTLLIERGNFNPIDAEDCLRAELLPVTMGFGPMIANMTLAIVSDYSFTTKILQYGHLPSHITGYALAVLCWLGGDNAPGHAAALRRDAANSYRQGLRYLHQTGDCLIQRDDWGRSIENHDLSVLLSDLSSEFEGRRVAALWELMSRDGDASQAVVAVADRLNDRSHVVRLNAAVRLGKWGGDAEASLSDLRSAIGSEKNNSVRMEAVRALGVICEAAGITREQRDELLDELIELRARTADPIVRDAVDEAMSRLGADVSIIGPNLAKAIRDAIAAVADERLQKLLDCVQRIIPDVERFLEEHFRDRDPELLARARDALREPPPPDPYAGYAEQTSGSVITNWRWL